MVETKKIQAIVLDKDSELTASILDLLEAESFEVYVLSNTEKALGLLKDKLFPLAIVGDPEGEGTPFDIMKKIVMTSPMTSMILITDLADEIVEEKAEGYGILGHVSRDFSSETLKCLLENFREIHKAMSPA